MQIYLDSFGAFLAVRQGMFAVRTKHAGERLFATREVTAILMTRGTGMSTDAALLAVGEDIPVLLIDAQTHFPLAGISSGRPGSIASIRKNQALFARSAAGFEWAGAQIAGKIAAQRNLLQHYSEHPAATPAYLEAHADADGVLRAMEKSMRSLPAPDARNWNAAHMETLAQRLRGLEGTASRLYFQQIARLLPAHYAGFQGRVKRPAYDPFNALLNYLYGMLYTTVHLSMLKAGVDPHIGVLHADRYGGAPVLVFDAIEPFRPWADAVALRLVLEAGLSPDVFEVRDDTEGLWLSTAGKDLVIDAMLACLEEYIAPEGEDRRARRKVLIDRQARELAATLLDLET